jgi:hypothetical protein
LVRLLVDFVLFVFLSLFSRYRWEKTEREVRPSSDGFTPGIDDQCLGMDEDGVLIHRVIHDCVWSMGDDE